MEQRIRKHPRMTNESHLTDFVDFNQGPMQLLQQGVNICVGDQIDERVIRHGARPTARVKKEPVDFMGGGEVEVNAFPASSYQPTINLNYPLISQPGPSTSPYQYHLGSPGAQYNMQQYAPSPEAKYNPTPSPQYNIAGSPPYPPIDVTYQPSVQFNINPGGQPQSESQNIDLGSLPSLSDSNLQVLEQFINVDNLSTSFSQNLSFTTEDEKKNNFDNTSSSNKEQTSNDLDKGGSNVFRISAKDVPSGFSGLLSDDISATENYLRNDVNMKSFNQLSSKE